MSNPNRLALPFIGVCVCIALLFPSFNTQSQHKPTKAKIEEVDISKFPVVDASAGHEKDPKKWAKREAKGRKYNNKYAPPIEQLNSSYLVDHVLIGLPALPINQSVAVIVGEIKDAKAYLSQDRKQIYSEFVVTIQSVLKNGTNQPMSFDSSIQVERFGGRALLPSGKVVAMAVHNQDMPQVGARYVLFLTKDEDESLTILTGYELRNGKVFPLDRVQPTHPMAQYKGQDEATLLNDLANSLAASPLN
jgi:hypothetical protein